jgi:cytochrome P450
MIVIAPYVIHRHRALWKKPDGFDPSRFLGNCASLLIALPTFRSGLVPRVCIGATFAIQEASIIVVTIMRNLPLEMVSGCTPWPVQKITLRPKDGLPMIVRRR